MTERMIEMNGLLLTTVSEFSGTDWRGVADRIPFAPGFDLEAIRRNDPNPFFVTLPVARVGAQSRGSKKFVYGETANRLIVDQIMTRQPEGGRGHVPDEAVATQYDLPDVMAVGALLDADGTTWSKFYVPQYATATREYYRAKMMSNARAAFSLWGNAKVNPATNEVVGLDLLRIDIADPARAGLPVEGVPIITSEMSDEQGDPTPSDANPVEGNHMGEEQRMAEMQAQTTRLQTDLTTLQTRMAEMAGVLGVEVDQIVATLRTLTTQTREQTSRIAEMQTMLNVEPAAFVATIRTLQGDAEVAHRVAEMLHEGEGDPQVSAVVARVTEMQTLLKAQAKAERRQRVLGLIDGSRDDVENPLVALPDLRPVVVAHMGDESTWPEDDAKITEMVQKILGQPHIQSIAKKLVTGTGGGPVALGATNNGGHGTEQTDEEIEKEAEQVAKELGLNQ